MKKSSHTIKIVICLKVFLLLFLATSEGLINFGELKLFAEDEPKSEEQKEEKETNSVATTLENLLEIPSFDSSKASKEDIDEYLSLIERKKEQINERIEILKIRENQLKELEGSIDQKIGKIDEEILFFKQTQQQEKSLKEERLNNLVDFYKKMTPKKAAPIMENLDRDLIVQLFQKFPKKQTMNILSLMNPTKAAEISEYYGRLNSIKEYDMLKEVNESLSDQFEKCKVRE